MEQSNLKFKLLESIGEIYERSKKCKLKPEFFSEIDEELVLLSDYFKLTKNQAFFVAVIFAINYKGETVDFSDLSKYFQCNPMTILHFSDDFTVLCEKNVVKKENSLHHQQLTCANEQYSVNEKIIEAILQNKSLPDLTEKKKENIVEVLGQLFHWLEQRQEESISTDSLFLKTRILMLKYVNFPLINKLAEFKFRTADNFLFLLLVWKTVAGEEQVDIEKATEDIYDNPVEKVNYLQKIVQGENALIKKDLVELVQAQFFNDMELKLTDQSHQLLKDCGVKTLRSHSNRKNIMEPSKILFRQLVFNAEMEERLRLIRNVLSDDKLTETQNRLSSKNLPKGITILFHGEPGTGKTELVLQLARETNRKIVKVDISQSKSLWYGESEKIIKRVFTDYHTLLKECDRTPVLLFNEADAIFSARRKLSSSNVSQTENAIQNIILDELERFEGILMATTNLTGNFDGAFDRRFLFKIKFQKPDLDSKAKIWRLKFPKLDKVESEMLASRFDFSGAQIDNVLRKSEMQEVICGEPVNLECILIFCREESQFTKNVKIGFSKS